MGRRVDSGLSIGASGQLSIDNYELMSVLSSQVAVGDLSLMDRKQLFARNIKNRTDIDSGDYFDVIAHGSKHAIEVYNNGKVLMVNWRRLARMLKENRSHKIIRLFSCNTGNGEECFAQNLANKLNRPVLAPTKYVFAWPNGKYFVRDGKKDKYGNIVPWGDYGEFKMFYPRRRRK